MTYRVGIVGAGFGAKAHLPAYAAHPAFDVVAIASPHSAGKIARERKIAAFRSCADMLEGAGLDVVSVAGPPFTHHPDVLAVLRAGKHVICEKPFALSVAQAEEMAAARRTGTAAAVMHEFRWIPQRIALKELVVNHHLDPLRHMEITQLLQSLRADVKRSKSWWFERECGGGLAGAWLSHIIDASNWLAGRAPLRSTGFLRTANPQREHEEGAFTSSVDDGAFALVDYGDGFIARLTADATTRVDSTTIAIHGEARTAVASGEDVVAPRLFTIEDDETAELECKPSPHARFASIGPNAPLIMDLLDEFVKQIETGKSSVPTFDEAVATQRILASIGY